MFLAYDSSLIRQTNDSGNYPIHSAASHGQKPILAELMRPSVDDVNIPNAAGNTCLHLGVIHNKQRIVEYLMCLPDTDPQPWINQ